MSRQPLQPFWDFRSDLPQEDGKKIDNYLSQLEFKKYNSREPILSGDVLLTDLGKYIIVGDINTKYGGCVNCTGQDEYKPNFDKSRVVAKASLIPHQELNGVEIRRQ